jgi:hypothetical protein
VAVPDVGKEDFTGDAVVKHDEAGLFGRSWWCVALTGLACLTLLIRGMYDPFHSIHLIVLMT